MGLVFSYGDSLHMHCTSITTTLILLSSGILKELHMCSVIRTYVTIRKLQHPIHRKNLAHNSLPCDAF